MDAATMRRLLTKTEVSDNVIPQIKFERRQSRKSKNINNRRKKVKVVAKNVASTEEEEEEEEEYEEEGYYEEGGYEERDCEDMLVLDDDAVEKEMTVTWRER